MLQLTEQVKGTAVVYIVNANTVLDTQTPQIVHSPELLLWNPCMFLPETLTLYHKVDFCHRFQ